MAGMAVVESVVERRSFGRLLRQHRERAGLGQERLAERSGMSVPTISNLERGVSRPRLETVNLLAQALALPIEERGDLLAAGLRARPTTEPAPPIATPAVPARHNLPVPPNALVGRDREMAAVRERMQEPALRLLTLTGAGGVGKTRMALAVAAKLVDQYLGGVWLAELAPLDDPALVPNAVAGILRLREEPSRPLSATLVERLRDQRILLLIDNCEHLLEACADLASTLLRACSGVRIMATSREGLGVSGEQIYHVSPLGLPDPHHVSPPDSVGSSEAVRLFVSRAQALRREFALTEHNAPAVVTICERLDGIPLAIELAAARIGSLAVEVLAERLDEGFGLLTLGPRDALPRQQTLRATMDWSWDLLGALEQTLLRRLSVFAGGWTLAAAEAVCSGIDVEVPAVLELLNGFANKSLLSLDATGRYALLETVRQYAGERLVEAGEDTTIRQQHLDWCMASAGEAEPCLIGPEQIG